MHIQPDHLALDPELFSRRFPAVAKGDTAAISASVDSPAQPGGTPTAGDAVAWGAGRDANTPYANAGPRPLSDASGVAAADDPREQELAALAKLLQSVTGIFRKYLQGGDELAAARTERLAERFESLSLLSDSELSLEMTRTLAVVRAARDGVPAAPPAEIKAEAEPASAARGPVAQAGNHRPGEDVLTPGLERHLPGVIRRAIDDLAGDADTDEKRGRLEDLRRRVARTPVVDGMPRPAAVLAGTYLTKSPTPPEFSRIV